MNVLADIKSFGYTVQDLCVWSFFLYLKSGFDRRCQMSERRPLRQLFDLINLTWLDFSWGSSFNVSVRESHSWHFWKVCVCVIWMSLSLSVSVGLQLSPWSSPSRQSLPLSGVRPRRWGHWTTAVWMWWEEEEMDEETERKRRAF